MKSCSKCSCSCPDEGEEEMATVCTDNDCPLKTKYMMHEAGYDVAPKDDAPAEAQQPVVDPALGFNWRERVIASHLDPVIGQLSELNLDEITFKGWTVRRNK